MKNPAKLLMVLLCSGSLVTLSAAVSTCPFGPIDETTLCTGVLNVPVNLSDICNNNFKEVACSNSSFMVDLSADQLVNLTSCYIDTVDPGYFSFLVSRLNKNKTRTVLMKFSSQFSSLSSTLREWFLNGTWPLIAKDLNDTAAPHGWIFSDIQPFLLNVTSDMVQCLQDENVSCQVFQELVKNLDSLFPNMTDGTKDELCMAFHSFLKNHTADSACSQTGNSSTWLQQNFGRFMRFSSFSHLSELNANFKPLEALNLLTLSQIANFTLELDAAINSSAINIILGTIRNSKDMSDFLGYINEGALLMNITGLSPLLLNRTFEVIKSNNSFTTTDWNQLIKDKLTIVLPEITVEQLTFIPQNISCDAYQVIIKSLDSSLTHMAPGKPENVYKSFIKPFMNKSGSSCAQNSSSINYLLQNFGMFSHFANYSDLVAFNKNFSALNVLDLLTLSQIATYSLDLDATNNSSAFASVLEIIQNSTDMYDFLGYLNQAAGLKNITALHSMAQALLNKTFEIINSTNSFTKWNQLIKDKLTLVLPEITLKQLTLIPKDINCDTYQVIVKSLNSTFLQMRESQENIYKDFIKPFMNNSGPACAQNSSSSFLDLNFGKFSQFANYRDLVSFNKNFSALDVLNILTLPQIADFSLDLNSSSNPSAVTKVLGIILNKDVSDFLGYINQGAKSRNITALSPTMAEALLNKTFNAIKANNSFTDWNQFIKDKLTLVLPEMTLAQLTSIPQNISCDAYQVIIGSLNPSFTQMTSGTPENIYKSFIKPYMTTSGPVCAQNSSSSSFLEQNFGKFSEFANYSDLVAFKKNFSALDVLSVLTLQQMASFSLELNASSDPTTAASIVGTLHNTTDLYDFLKYINNGIFLKNTSLLNSALSQALLNKTFETVKANISMFNKSDWTQLLQGNLGAMVPEISSDQLSLIPTNISCDSYQSILGILDLNFPKMNSGNQQNIYKSLIKPYLTNKGLNCSQNLSSSAILKQNLGKFSQFADYKDLKALNISGSEILSSLTMKQVVDFSLDTNINSTVAAGIVGMIQNVTDVNTFLASLNTAGFLSNVTSLSPYLSQALLTKTFQMLKQNFSSFNNSDWAQLFQEKLSLVLPEMSKDQLSLIPNNISCSSYQPIFHSLQSSFSKMNSKNQQDAYKSFIKPYLKKKGNAITCYNDSDPSASWLVDNLGSYMIYTSEEDLILFANESMLQTFANDPSSVELVTRLELPKDTAIYFTSLLTSSASFNLNSLPDTFLCFLTPSALVNLTAADTLAITKKINQQCYNTTGGQTPAAPTPEDVQVAISLVSKLDNFSADTLMNLGKSAMGLSMGQINKISDGTLKSSLSSLSNVTGWSVGQTRSIMEKLLNSNYQIEDLSSLGSLITGLPSKKLQELNSTAVLNAVKDAQFASKLAIAPPALQNTFVMKIISANSTTSSVVKNVPASLASFIPKSFLLFKSEKPSLEDVNGKSWSPDQASMFFDDIANSTADYSLLSSSVLQGFTCSTPAKISNSQVKLLGMAMKNNNASLSEDQLNCLSRQITKGGYTADLDLYPGEIFLFLNSANYSSIGNCTAFFTKVGKANITVLSGDAKLRSTLLTKALSCMKISGPSLKDGDITVLGQLTCELNASYIAGSPPGVLTQLSQCQSFSTEQQMAIQTLLSKDNSVFGAPATWTKDTLNSLGGISGFLTKDMLTNISSVSFKVWMKEAIQTSALTKSQFAAIVTKVLSTRARRAAGCASGKEITASNVNDPLLPLSYTPTELDACLGNDTLTNYLSVLSSKTFTDPQLTVMKNKLDAVYPTGYPESVLINLGEINRVCRDADVSKWNITSVDTLSSLLSVSLSDILAQSEIGKYLSSGNQLTAAALNVISSRYVCLLSSAQVQSMNNSAISDAKTLDLSACSQAVKDAFYAQAKSAFQSDSSQVSTYFNLIKPYLGGASAADLKTLAAKNPNMDIGTFVKLNPSAVMSLTVNNVKGLLGTNVEDLKTQATNSIISNWIAIQKQSDLDTLGLGITGGIRDYVTTKSPVASASTFTHGLSIFLGIFGSFLLF